MPDLSLVMVGQHINTIEGCVLYIHSAVDMHIAYWLLFYLRKSSKHVQTNVPKAWKKTYLEKCLIYVLHGSISIEKELLLWGISRAPPDSTMLEALGTPASNMWKGSSCQRELGCMKPFTVHSLVCSPWFVLVHTCTNISTAKCQNVQNISIYYQAYISLIHAGWNIYIYTQNIEMSKTRLKDI